MAIAHSTPLSPARAASLDGRRAVRFWLIAVAGLVFLMVLVGGATRVSEAGLSITQWKPVTGVLPPLSQAEWQAEFDRYRQIPQFAALNAGMTLEGFKTIFWWEWGHRLLARITGAAFILPGLWFWRKGQLKGALGRQVAVATGLLALEPIVGWWMVTSGLSERIEVAPQRLALHLLIAAATFGALIYAAVGLDPVAFIRNRHCEKRSDERRLSFRTGYGDEAIQESSGAPRSPGSRRHSLSGRTGVFRRPMARDDGDGAVQTRHALGERPNAEAPPRGFAISAWIFAALIFCQIGLGALVAGLRAGLIYNTWPLMGSGFVPGEAFRPSPLKAIFADPATAQFDHRMIGYLVVVFALVQAAAALRAAPGSPLASRAIVLAGVALIQVALGVATLLAFVPIELALPHQALALVLFGLAIVHVRATELERGG